MVDFIKKDIALLSLMLLTLGLFTLVERVSDLADDYAHQEESPMLMQSQTPYQQLVENCWNSEQFTLFNSKSLQKVRSLRLHLAGTRYLSAELESRVGVWSVSHLSYLLKMPSPTELYIYAIHRIVV